LSFEKNNQVRIFAGKKVHSAVARKIFVSCFNRNILPKVGCKWKLWITVRWKSIMQVN